MSRVAAADVVVMATWTIANTGRQRLVTTAFHSQHSAQHTAWSMIYYNLHGPSHTVELLYLSDSLTFNNCLKVQITTVCNGRPIFRDVNKDKFQNPRPRPRTNIPAYIASNFNQTHRYH